MMNLLPRQLKNMCSKDMKEDLSAETVLEKLEKESLVIITGNPGDGQSKLAKKCIDDLIYSHSNISPVRIRRSSDVVKMRDVMLKGDNSSIILVDGPFDQIDTRTEITEDILREVEDRIEYGAVGVKCVIVMQKDTLNFVKTYFKNMEWLRNERIIDMTGSDPNMESLTNHIQNMDGHCIFLLGLIALSDGSLSSCTLYCLNSEDSRVRHASEFAGIAFNNSMSKFLRQIATAFLDVYIIKKSGKFFFKDQTVSDAVYLSLSKMNPWKYIELCPLSKLQMPFVSMLNEQSLLDSFEKRIISEMERDIPRFDDFMKLNVWHKDVLFGVGPKLVNSMLTLEDSAARQFLNSVHRSGNIPLLSFLFISLPNLKYNRLEKTLVLNRRTSGNAKHICLCREEIPPSLFETKQVSNSIPIHFINDFFKRNILSWPGGRSVFVECSYPAREFERYIANEREKIEIYKVGHKDCECRILPFTARQKEQPRISSVLLKLLNGFVGASFINYKHLLIETGEELKMGWYIQIAVSHADAEFMKSTYSNIRKSSNCFLTSRLDEIVTTKFKKLHKDCTFLSIWTGTQYEENKGKPIDTIVAIVQNKQKHFENEFWGSQVIVREENEFSQEATDALSHTRSNFSNDVIELSGHTVCNLFKKHTNITLISTSSIRSQRYGKENAVIMQRPCVVLYCRVKGIIPRGEDMFPQEIENHPVDVREGSCSFAANTIRAGDKIKSENRTWTGTLGGFVNCAGSKNNAFITCAHVLYQRKDLGENLEKLSRKTEQNVSVSINDKWHTTGRVRRAVFNNTKEEEVSVDAALVDLTDCSFGNDGQFSETYSRKQLQGTGIYGQRTISFSSGKIETINSNNKKNVFLKVGAESGLTAGQFCGPIHPKLDNLNDEYSPSIYLYHQIEIVPLSKETPFLKSGDSGSFIFMLKNTNPVELTCVGIAVASTSHGSCIMTPISRVLEALKLPENSLSVFENSSVNTNPEYVTNEALVNLLKRQTDTLKDFLQENTENIKTEITELSKRIKTVEDKISNNLEERRQDQRK